MPTIMEFSVSDKDRKNTTSLLLKHFDKKICSKIEKGFYDYTEQFCKSSPTNMQMASAIYRDRVREFLYNCDNDDNRTIQELKKKVANKEYNPYNLAFLQSYELDEDNWMKIILRKKTTEEKLNNLPTIDWRPCRDCKSVKHFYVQLQTRSADEPMTTFYICKNCNKTTRLNN